MVRRRSGLVLASGVGLGCSTDTGGGFMSSSVAAVVLLLGGLLVALVTGVLNEVSLSVASSV